MNTVSRVLDTTIGPRFLSVSNADLLDAIRVAGQGFDIEHNAVRGVGNDRRMTAFASLRGLAFDVPGEGTLVPRLAFRNDNTGRKALSITVGLFRLVCTNGLTVGIPGLSFDHRIRHVAGPKAHGLLDALPQAMSEAIDWVASGGLLDQIEAAKEVRVQSPIEVVASLPIGRCAKDLAIWNLAHGTIRPEDKITTAWGLYNLVNESVRSRSRTEFTALTKDEGLLSDIIALAAA